MKKNGFVAPIVVLSVICLVMAFALGGLNSVTEPIITEASAKAAEEAKKEVLPEADSFKELEKNGLKDSVVSAFSAENGAGYVFIMAGAGYGGEMQIIVGVDSQGLITGTKVLSHSETAGLGARVTGESFNAQFKGQDESLSGVELISGSTISSKCFKGLVEDAFAAFNALKGGE